MSSIKSLLATVLLASAATLTFAQSPAPVTDGTTKATASTDTTTTPTVPAMVKHHKAPTKKMASKRKPTKKHLKVSKVRKHVTAPQA